MRNDLPKKPWCNECAVVNMDDKNGPGSHWTAYVKRGDSVLYFDSLGDLPPPLELRSYLQGNEIKYNHKRYQKPTTFNCGQLCVTFLQENV